jgi:signal transduction histidine kinase/CheY-like chemotaxis protein
LDAFPPSARAGALPRARSSRRIVGAAAALAVVAYALTGYWLWVLRDHRIDFTNRQIHLQTIAVAEHVLLVGESVEGALAALADDLRTGRLALTPDALRLRLGSNTHLRALSLVDADGHVLASSTDGASPNAATTLELTHAVTDAPQGVARVTARIDTQFIAGFFARVASAKDARVGLFTRDGQAVAGSIDLSTEFGPGDHAALLQRLLAVGRDASTEHGQVFAAARAVKGLDMVAVTLRERDAVLAPWRAYLVDAAVATTLALAALAFIVRRLLREMQARVEAQATLERTRDELQVRLQRTRRLESLGRLSGGIAHDFNNILAVVLGCGDLLQQTVAPGSAQARQVDQVLRAGERGKSLVARILSFSRGGARAHSVMDVDAVVGEAMELLAATAPASIRLDLALEADDARVLGDPSLLFEALSNLCTNAINAMPQGGTLVVGTATRRIDTEQPLSHGTLGAGTWAVVGVSDDGQGMGADVVEHLFEPFFTTRAAQGGTGLGLAMVHGAVREMSGVIDVRSAPGQGARFELCFPLTTATMAPAIDAAPAAPRGSGQVVMIVDDEPALVAMTEDVVAGLGYEPVGFVDPRQALAALQATPERFDVVLTDQVMPYLVGTELTRRLHGLRPQLPVLLASGYGGPDLDRQAAAAGVRALLQKPLHRGELATHLARVLAAA